MNRPYAESFEAYRRAGWLGTLPLPKRGKWPPPQEYTGQVGIWPSGADAYEWATNGAGAGNIALRLPTCVIGIDVDNYAGKQGGTTLAALEARYGPLPATWWSTSREDGISGIRLFRIPEGLRWPSQLKPGIEILLYRHRYAVVWPSIHPEGRTYRWIAPDGTTSIAIPAPEDLPELPAAWVEGLTGGEAETLTPSNSYDDEQVRAWLSEHGTGTPCRRMTAALARALTDLSAPGSAHDATLRPVMHIARLAEIGHPGANTALAEMRAVFLAAVTNPSRAGEVRDMRTAVLEWARTVVGAVNKVTADPAEAPGCTCEANALTSNGTAGTSTGTSTGTAALAPLAQLTPEPREPLSDTEAAELAHQFLVARELSNLRAKREAARLLDEEEAHARFRIPPSRFTLREELELPDEPVRYRIDKLMTVGANVLLTAQYKTGKTTLVGELARSLADGIPFMGRYATALEAGKRVAIFNYELDEKQYRRWLRDLSIANPDRVAVLNLRGYRVPPTQRFAENWLVEWLESRDVGFWIVDPFARAYVGCGKSENDNTEVGEFLDTLDVIKSRAGVSDLLMATHTGREVQEEGKERARGATRLDDWPDVRWFLTKDEEDRRYFRAHGRDVNEAEEQLAYDPDTRALCIGGWDRKGQADRDLESEVIAYVRNNPGQGVNDIRSAMGARKADVGKALRTAEHAGDIYTIKRGGKTEHHFSRDTSARKGV